MTMDEVEQAKKNIMELLRSIETLDDLKEHKEEILDHFEALFKAALQSLNKYLESSLSSPDEAQQEEFEKFADDQYILDDEIGQEFERIDGLPGASEYFESFQGEIESRINPYLEEFSGKIENLVTNLMGEMLGGMMEGLKEGFGDMMGDMGNPEEFDVIDISESTKKVCSACGTVIPDGKTICEKCGKDYIE
jgi:hypothetical protein